MTFSYPTLALAGAALAAVPLVIHLLNLRRRRRVAWAAMDFLIESDRKNRTWVRLSEWLLLAARMAAVALAGALAATPRSADLLENLFGAEPTHHVVLLDDTASMQRRGPDGVAWDEAIAAIDRLIDRADETNDQVSVYRYTDATVGREAPSGADSDEAFRRWRPTHLDGDPANGLEILRESLADSSGTRTLLYVLSDLATTSHPIGGDWEERFETLARNVDDVVLGRCGDPAAGNLSVDRVRLAPGPVAAGVETRLVIEVVNHSDMPASEQSLAIRRDGQPLTGVTVGPLDANDRRTLEIPITFAGIGLHTVEVQLPGDQLEADNVGRLAIETPAAQPIALIDPSELGVESRVFAAAMRPIGKARSGWAPARLAGVGADDLADVAAVFVLDAERLDRRAIDHLRGYAASGGGVFWMLGPRTDADWFNRQVAGDTAGPGLAPWRVGPPTSSEPVSAGTPSLRIADHPAMRVLAGERNAFLPIVRTFVRRRLATSGESPTVRRVSLAAPPSEWTALAETPAGEPLLIESRFGQGRLIALLTSSATGGEGAPPWSNLATLPIFPVLVNDLAGWLSQGRLASVEESIGDAGNIVDQAVLQRLTPLGDFETVGGLGPANPASPAEPGVYRRVADGSIGEAFAARVDPLESDLRAAKPSDLRARWSDVAHVARAADLFLETSPPASRTPLHAAALLLFGLLAGERLLAYRGSYLRSTGGPA